MLQQAYKTDDGLVCASCQVMLHFSWLQSWSWTDVEFLVDGEGKILQTMIVSELVEERTPPSAVSQLTSSIHVSANTGLLSSR